MPILDLYKLYCNLDIDCDFNQLLIQYEHIFPLHEKERALLYILIMIPPKIDIYNHEFDNCINFGSKLSKINLINSNFLQKEKNS